MVGGLGKLGSGCSKQARCSSSSIHWNRFSSLDFRCLRGLHPVVACALERFAAFTEVREVVRQSGYSHRRFIALFRRAAGLSPKTYCRVLRFRRAVERTFAARDASLADIALDVGYSDQPHFTREFRAIAGISPLQYRHASAVHANHVPIRISGNFVRGR